MQCLVVALWVCEPFPQQQRKAMVSVTLEGAVFGLSAALLAVAVAP